MLDYIYKFAYQNNCDFISLLAEKSNIIAQSFYENAGYKKEIGYIKPVNYS